MPIFLTPLEFITALPRPLVTVMLPAIVCEFVMFGMIVDAEEEVEFVVLDEVAEDEAEEVEAEMDDTDVNVLLEADEIDDTVVVDVVVAVDCTRYVREL